MGAFVHSFVLRFRRPEARPPRLSCFDKRENSPDGQSPVYPRYCLDLASNADGRAAIVMSSRRWMPCSDGVIMSPPGRRSGGQPLRTISAAPFSNLPRPRAGRGVYRGPCPSPCRPWPGRGMGGTRTRTPDFQVVGLSRNFHQTPSRRRPFRSCGLPDASDRNVLWLACGGPTPRGGARIRHAARP